MPLRALSSSPNRRAGRATFELLPPPAPAGRYAPATDEFLFWQCREAALRAVAVFERLDRPLRKWAPQARRRLRLIPVAGADLNAYYDRDSCSFFTYETDGRITRTGASADVVAHEVGHALLDAIRPDLWDISLPEHGAFHEAFGDCIALLAALSDAKSRAALVRKTPDLGRRSFVEAMMEDLAAGVRRAYGPGESSSQPRHARNRYRWQAPTSLPGSGGPSVLTGDAHSFSRVFTGCFYDVIRGVFRASSRKDANAVRAAADTAGRLLIAGTRAAVEQLRFFRAVGEAMLQADVHSNGGANQQVVMDAFEGHGIPLASPARTFSVRSTLTSSAPRAMGARRGHGARAAIRPLDSERAVDEELRRQLGAAPGQRLQRTALASVAPSAQKVVHQREVPLTGLSERLAGVVALAPQPVVVSRQGRATVLRSSIPAADVTAQESRYFVATLLDGNAIAFDGKPAQQKAARSARAARAPKKKKARPATPSQGAITHAVQKRGGKKVLVRVRFAGGCVAHRLLP